MRCTLCKVYVGEKTELKLPSYAEDNHVEINFIVTYWDVILRFKGNVMKEGKR
jgi:hypothetical protein